VQRERAELLKEAPAPAVLAVADENVVLSLQRTAGNRLVTRMIQSTLAVARDTPPPTRFGGAPVTKLDSTGWHDPAKEGPHIPLYAELATLLQATKLEDVKGTDEKSINGARHASYAELKPGLNYVGKLADRGQTGFLYDGKFDSTMPVSRTGPLPDGVAIVLGGLAFEPDNKASALGVLRHEIEHGVHDRLALDWLKRWRADAKAAKVSFTSWLDKQKMAPVDRALVKERVSGARSGTEALGNAEGFIAGFPLEPAGIGEGDHPMIDELEDTADYWLKTSDAAIRDETVRRLAELAAKLSGERRTTFQSALKALKAKNKELAKLADPLLAVK
jgi:hypothetical protein